MIRPAAYRHLGGPSRSARADSQDIAALATDAVIRNLPGSSDNTEGGKGLRECLPSESGRIMSGTKKARNRMVQIPTQILQSLQIYLHFTPP